MFATDFVSKKRLHDCQFTPCHLNIYDAYFLYSGSRKFIVVKVTVQFEWCFRLMEHISVIS